MGVTQIGFVALLVLVGAQRLLEVRHSKRNRQRMAGAGVEPVAERHFGAMVALHGGVLLSAGLEVIFLRRPFLPALAIPMGALFLFAQILRVWVIRTLSGHWNVGVMASAKLGVVTGGPFRWVRHPNYMAVIIEMFSLPLIHTAYLTALWATLANAWVLSKRLSVEEPALMADPVYRAMMSQKPRFLPKIFS
jgi:methyltransferase